MTKQIIFITDAHSGQLNSLIAIAISFWQKCDQQNTEIVFACHPKYLQEEHLANIIPGYKILPIDLNPTLKVNWDFKSEPRDLKFISKTMELAFDFDHYKSCSEILEKYLESSAKKPDLVVSDILAYSTVEIFSKYGIPFVLNVPLPANGFINNPLQTMFTFPSLATGFPKNMSFNQKIQNAIFTTMNLFTAIFYLIPFIHKRSSYIEAKSDSSKYKLTGYGGPAEAADQAKAIFINTVFGLEYPFSLPSTAILIGACLDPVALATSHTTSHPDLEWISARPNVVYIALGTLSKPSKKYIINLLTAFQNSRQIQKKMSPNNWHCFIKIPAGCYVPNHGDSLLENVKIVSWVDSQLNVLSHPNVKLFVSHCGGNSVNEGVYFGKAILGIPQWYDCYDLAQRVQDAEIGLRVFRTVPEPSLDELQSKMQLMIEGIDGFLDKAGRLKEKMRAAGGANEAAKKILELLQ
ncbi:hypothetical protein HK096_004328 [Nowakowskiella sp. JEL0078]|nr:hypothetical protein HK096_004328 [Nowakowskiella sp. JEL0078]